MSVFENNGWGFTVGIGLYSYSWYTITFANGEIYTYDVAGMGPSAGKVGAWFSLIGCNDCTPDSLEGLFGDFDLTLGLGIGISSDTETTVGRANLGLGFTYGASVTRKNNEVADKIQNGIDDLEGQSTSGLGDVVLNEEEPANGGWPNDNELTGSSNDNSSDDDNDSSSSSSVSSSSSSSSSGSSSSSSSSGSGAGGGGWNADNELTVGDAGGGGGSGWQNDNELTGGNAGYDCRAANDNYNLNIRKIA